MIRLSLLPVSRAAATSALLVGLVGCNSDGALPVAADPKLDAQAAVPDGSVPKGDLGTSPPSFPFGEPLYQGGVPLYTAAKAADLNHDGRVDLVSAGGALSVLLARPGGGWMAPLDLPLEPIRHALALDDLNRDGQFDAAVLPEGSSELLLFLGRGDGSFLPPTRIALGARGFDLVDGDFDRDGLIDLAVANGTRNSVSVMRGKGDGSFQPPAFFATDSDTIRLVAADFDGDRDFDLAASNRGSNDVSLLLGDGKGGFAKAVNLALASAPGAIAVGDASGDGRADLFVVLSNGAEVTLLYSTPGKLFDVGMRFLIQQFAVENITTGDWDHDGRADFALDGVGLKTWLVSGSGLLQARSGPTAEVRSPRYVATVDYDRDGRDDLLAASYEGLTTLFSGTANGTFAPTVLPTIVGNHYALPVDVDGDKHLDVVGGYRTPDDQTLSVLRSTGKGRFELGSQYLVSSAAGLAAGDLDGDGVVDLVVGSLPVENKVGASLLGKGDGTFRAPVENGANTWSTDVGLLVDLDGDGKLDLAGEGKSTLRIHRGLGNGLFEPARSIGNAAVGSPIAGNFRGGKFPDLAALQFGFGAKLVVFINAGLLQFGSWATSIDRGARLAAGDFNGDGRMDFAVGDGTEVTLYLADARLGYEMGTVLSPAGGATWTTAVDLNLDGHLDLAVAGTVLELYPGRGDGTFGPSQTLPLHHAAKIVHAADFDGDGKPDLLTAGDQGSWLALWRNELP